MERRRTLVLLEASKSIFDTADYATDRKDWGDGYSANIIDPAAGQDTLQFASLDADVNSSGAPMSEHAQFRNYSFHQGRWLAPDLYDGSYDPTNPQSFNRYAYVGNNPLTFTDPTGLHCAVDIGCHVGGWAGGDLSIFDTVSTSAGTYSYGDDVWDATMQDGFGGGVTEGDDGSLWSSAETGDQFLGSTWQSLFLTGSIETFSMANGYVSTEATSNLPTPTRLKATIPGTSYCGPGGGGTPTDRVDGACAAHDKCYGNAGVSFLNNIGWPKTPQQSAAIQACDAALAGTINGITWPTSNEQGEATLVTTYFNLPSGYNLHPFW